MALLAKLLVPAALIAIVVFAAASTSPSHRSNAKQPQRTLFSQP
jgi:hypothetical protein